MDSALAGRKRPTTSGQVVKFVELADDVAWQALPAPDTVAELTRLEAVIHDYLHASMQTAPLYHRWTLADPRFAAVAPHFSGMRLLRQDPTECLFSFLCSSNNNIGRITKMLTALRSQYGRLIAQHEGMPNLVFCC